MAGLQPRPDDLRLARHQYSVGRIYYRDLEGRRRVLSRNTGFRVTKDNNQDNQDKSERKKTKLRLHAPCSPR